MLSQPAQPGGGCSYVCVPDGPYPNLHPDMINLVGINGFGKERWHRTKSADMWENEYSSLCVRELVDINDFLYFVNSIPIGKPYISFERKCLFSSE
jgi:hypothetical protein